jgi:hypothetical protein
VWLNMEDLEQAHRRLGVTFSSTDEEVEHHPMAPTIHVPMLPLCRITKHPFTRYHTHKRSRMGGVVLQIKAAFRKAAFAAHPDRAQVCCSFLRSAAFLEGRSLAAHGACRAAWRESCDVRTFIVARIERLRRRCRQG